jgi:ABC-2 type transport system ATP-binding protein
MTIVVDGLRKTFVTGRRKDRKSVEAVKGVSFDVASGERLAFIGPNGAGKSTSIKILTGILHPSDGRATVLGITPWEARKQLAARIGVLFGQRSMLWSELTPRQSYRMLGAIHGLDRTVERQRVETLLELFDATDLVDQPVRTLSLGQRMRCELAACLLHEPEILFLDEPTIGLDLLSKQRFRELLIRINEQQRTTIFLTSHDVADIEQVAQRAIVINHGEVIHDGEVPAMRSSMMATKLIDVALTSAAAPPTMPGVTVLEHNEAAMKLSVDTTKTPVRAVLDHLLAGTSVSDLTVVDPPLEDVIALIYERPQA